MAGNWNYVILSLAIWCGTGNELETIADLILEGGVSLATVKNVLNTTVLYFLTKLYKRLHVLFADLPYVCVIRSHYVLWQ